MTQISNFEYGAKTHNYSKHEIFAARYCLLAALDEAIMRTTWGDDNTWKQKTLVGMFYNELDSGNKFYIILEELLHKPRQNIHILELIYFILSLGFVGKYYGDEHKINNIRENIFTIIVPYKPNALLEDNINKNIINKKQPVKMFLFMSLITVLIVLLTSVIIFERKNLHEQEILFSLLDKNNS